MQQTCIYPLLLISVLGSPALVAEANDPPTPAPPTVTIEALVEEALQNNPELIFLQAEVDAAAAEREAAALPANPELTASVGRKSVEDAGLTDEGVAWSVSVVQAFEWPGRIGLRKAIANRDLELAELGLDRFRKALAGRVRVLAYGQLAAQQKATAAQEVANRLAALQEVLVQRDPAGLTPLLETRVVEATEVIAQRAAGEATREAQSAAFELNALRGVAPTTSIPIAEAPLNFPPATDPTTLLAAARTDNFELRVRSIELAQQGFRLDLAKHERYPAIAVEPAFSEEHAGEMERVISLGISTPLPLWDHKTGAIKAAKARQLQAESSLLLAQRDVERQVLAASLTYASTLREMSRWRPDAIQQFREAADLADRHYRLGAVPVATFIELQQQYLEAVETLLATRLDALEAAQQLELLTGLPMPLATSVPTEGVK